MTTQQAHTNFRQCRQDAANDMLLNHTERHVANALAEKVKAALAEKVETISKFTRKQPNDVTSRQELKEMFQNNQTKNADAASLLVLFCSRQCETLRQLGFDV